MKRPKFGDLITIRYFAGTWVYSGPCTGKGLKGLHVVMLWSTGRLERIRLKDITGFTGGAE